MRDLFCYLVQHPDVANALAAVVAAIIAAIALVVALLGLWFQRRHNFKSVTPVVWIAFGDFEDQISVTIQNKGVGPLFIRRFSVKRDAEVKGDLIGWMTGMPEGTIWSMFVCFLEGRCLAPGDELVLLRLDRAPGDKKFVDRRNRCRAILKTLQLEIRYSDVYDRKMPTFYRDFAWFGRSK